MPPRKKGPADHAPELTPYQLEQNRQAYMNWLYERDGRHDPAHPDHCRWSGLAVKRQEELIRQALEVMGRRMMRAQIRSIQKEPKLSSYYGLHDPAQRGRIKPDAPGKNHGL